MKKFGIELKNISDTTGKDIWVIPYKNWKNKDEFETLYERARVLYWTKLYNEEDTKILDDIIMLVIDSSLFYNSQFSTTNSTGKDIKANIARAKKLERDIKAGRI